MYRESVQVVVKRVLIVQTVDFQYSDIAEGVWVAGGPWYWDNRIDDPTTPYGRSVSSPVIRIEKTLDNNEVMRMEGTKDSCMKFFASAIRLSRNLNSDNAFSIQKSPYLFMTAAVSTKLCSISHPVG